MVGNLCGSNSFRAASSSCFFFADAFCFGWRRISPDGCGEFSSSVPFGLAAMSLSRAPLAGEVDLARLPPRLRPDRGVALSPGVDIFWSRPTLVFTVGQSVVLQSSVNVVKTSLLLCYPNRDPKGERVEGLSLITSSVVLGCGCATKPQLAGEQLN